nr:MAG TPA: hypothetical protein [Caudoviricetes sp.]
MRVFVPQEGRLLNRPSARCGRPIEWFLKTLASVFFI